MHQRPIFQACIPEKKENADAPPPCTCLFHHARSFQKILGIPRHGGNASRPKAQQGAAKTCPHPPKGPSSGSARPRPYGSALPQEIIRILFRSGKRAKIGRQVPVRPSGEKTPCPNRLQGESGRRRPRRERPFSSLQPPSVRQRIPAKATCCLLGGTMRSSLNALSIIKRGSPKRAAWGPSRTKAYPSGIRQAGGHNAPPVCREPRFPLFGIRQGLQGTPFRFELLRDGRQRRRTCAQFFQKPILRFAVRYHDPPPNYTATKGRLCPFGAKWDSSCSSLSGIWETTPDAERLSR